MKRSTIITNAVFWISITLFVIGVFGGLMWDKNRRENFRCPKCNRLVSIQKGDILFKVKECDNFNHRNTLKYFED